MRREMTGYDARVFISQASIKQAKIDADFAPKKLTRKIICLECKRGPQEGAELKKVGWIWRCVECRKRGTLRHALQKS